MTIREGVGQTRWRSYSISSNCWNSSVDGAMSGWAVSRQCLLLLMTRFLAQVELWSFTAWKSSRCAVQFFILGDISSTLGSAPILWIRASSTSSFWHVPWLSCLGDDIRYCWCWRVWLCCCRVSLWYLRERTEHLSTSIFHCQLSFESLRYFAGSPGRLGSMKRCTWEFFSYFLIKEGILAWRLCFTFFE